MLETSDSEVLSKVRKQVLNSFFSAPLHCVAAASKIPVFPPDQLLSSYVYVFSYLDFIIISILVRAHDG